MNKMYFVLLTILVENGYEVIMRKNVLSTAERELEFTSCCGHFMEIHSV
jgi:hypothetical protein